MATVHVVLVDAASGKPIGQVDLQPDHGLARAHRLVIVDWCAARWIRP
jgi:hypothetical protein